MSVELFGLFLASRYGCSPDQITIPKGDPAEVADLLQPFWGPLTAEPAKSFLQVTPYDPRGAGDFDAMIEAMAADPEGNHTNRSDSALTVWSERLKQAMMVLLANGADGKQVMLPPRDLPKNERQIAAACLWLHRMELPFAPGTASPIGMGGGPASLQCAPTPTADGSIGPREQSGVRAPVNQSGCVPFLYATTAFAVAAVVYSFFR